MCRNGSKGSPLRGKYLSKKGFQILRVVYPPRALIEVKFLTAKRTHVPVTHAKFHVNWCNDASQHPVGNNKPGSCHYQTVERI